MKRSLSLFAITSGMLAALFVPAAQAAATPAAADDPALTALAPCIDAAESTGAQAWVCTAKGLTVTTDAVGRPGGELVPIAPAIPTRTDGEVGVLDDYDYWCENGSVCHLVINDYTAETKGNAAYGNANGVIGTFDVVLRTNLSGRGAQWRISLIRDSGPYLQFHNVRVNCWEEINNWPDNSCGTYGDLYPRVTARWNSSTLYSARLVNSNEYYGAANAYFTPDGYGRYTMGALESLYFHCYAGRNCIFP